MIIFPYDARICQHYSSRSLKDIQDRLNYISIEQGLPEAPYGVRGEPIKGINIVTPQSAFDEINGFTQLLVVPRTRALIFDARPYSRLNREGGVDITAQSDYQFQIVRAILTDLRRQNLLDLDRLGNFPAIVFTRWLSLGLTQRLGLAVEHQIRLSILFAYYYLRSVGNQNDSWENERTMLAQRVQQITTAPTPQIIELAEKIEKFDSIDHLMEAIQNHVGSLRLEKLNYTELYTIVSASWIGVNSRENVGVALEHMPTFVAMVATSLNERSFTKTMIGRRAETVGRPQDRIQFARQVKALVQDRLS